MRFCWMFSEALGGFSGGRAGAFGAAACGLCDASSWSDSDLPPPPTERQDPDAPEPGQAKPSVLGVP
eukprot:3450886-Rhodomonas_salina.1